MWLLENRWRCCLFNGRVLGARRPYSILLAMLEEWLRSLGVVGREGEMYAFAGGHGQSVQKVQGPCLLPWRLFPLSLLLRELRQPLASLPLHDPTIQHLNSSLSLRTLTPLASTEVPTKEEPIQVSA
jgi:hypothetical protein